MYINERETGIFSEVNEAFCALTGFPGFREVRMACKDGGIRQGNWANMRISTAGRSGDGRRPEGAEHGP